MVLDLLAEVEGLSVLLDMPQRPLVRGTAPRSSSQLIPSSRKVRDSLDRRQWRTQFLPVAGGPNHLGTVRHRLTAVDRQLRRRW